MTEIPQISDTVFEKPRRETASAFTVTPSRDFDGGLLRRWTYRLDRSDALAYLQLKREWSGRAKWALGAWFMAGDIVFGLLPGWIKGPDDGWQSWAVFLGAMALQWALVLLGINIWQRFRAARMLPAPIHAEFEEWVDCVAGTDILTYDCAYLSPELIGQVLETPTHIFVLNYDTAIVVPLRAFADREEAAQIARHLRALAAGPYYFDAEP
ncbi:hypothetical protein GCM10010873_03180 [Cypionkella aquatica]|uniref:YcxB-like protein domain-containing protein n=1 Tax=Cypionkella aquatica TaxID=1756042 RepID=A0AA37U009_9RHOB|nr:hypothetical protein [Cypionkella aquatica]GLS85345.1 hypothetical protein GCM10010873_03180 [Cypionkella aquatica]